MSEKLTADELRQYWNTACNCDPVPIEDFFYRAEAAGFAKLRRVTKDDLAESFAAERGIEPGGLVWSLTATGLAALKDTTHER